MFPFSFFLLIPCCCSVFFPFSVFLLIQQLGIRRKSLGNSSCCSLFKGIVEKDFFPAAALSCSPLVSFSLFPASALSFFPKASSISYSQLGSVFFPFSGTSYSLLLPFLFFLLVFHFLFPAAALPCSPLVFFFLFPASGNEEKDFLLVFHFLFPAAALSCSPLVFFFLFPAGNEESSGEEDRALQLLCLVPLKSFSSLSLAAALSCSPLEEKTFRLLLFLFSFSFFLIPCCCSVFFPFSVFLLIPCFCPFFFSF